MGDMVSSIFGGGYQAPEAPQTAAIPNRDTADTEEKDTRDAERRKLRARAGGVRSTLLTSPLGNTGQAANPSGLLGRGVG